jgi:hypothetical protein
VRHLRAGYASLGDVLGTSLALGLQKGAGGVAI